MTEPEDKQRELNRLITQMREGSNADALKAVDELRRRGWMFDGSLRGCNLEKADLHYANLNRANLVDTYLVRANLARADLSQANLRRANLGGTILRGASIEGADFEEALCNYTIFADVDLSAVRGLKKILHFAPSVISVDTLYRSKGSIPEVFLRGCGVPKEFLEFTRGLFGENAIEFRNCFISYSHKDVIFAKKLYQRLRDRGVNSYIDFENLKGGDFWADVINQAIHHYEKLLVCCSENSLHSLGVDREVNTALRIEERLYAQSNEKVSIIIPVDMDGYIWHCENHVARRLQERHIINAKNWQNDFAAVLADILKALRTDEGREDPPEPKL
ncbi:MAG: toll/interleukin-1 receptor domain-containing protein [Anaerolineae bacterium]|nr:toll/interleukin-1 receptor domain-containing protein [Anaerolineae bacterium]